MPLVSFFYKNKPRGKIDNVIIDATTMETITRTAQISSDPIESGSDINDNIFLNPYSLKIKGIITNTPFDEQTSPYSNRAKVAYEELLILFQNRIPFDVVTGLDIYTYVFFTSFIITRDPTIGEAISFDAEFQPLILVSPQTIKIPRNNVKSTPITQKDKSQSTVDKGNQQAQNKDDVSKKEGSVLARLFERAFI